MQESWVAFESFLGCEKRCGDDHQIQFAKACFSRIERRFERLRFFEIAERDPRMCGSRSPNRQVGDAGLQVLKVPAE